MGGLSGLGGGVGTLATLVILYMAYKNGASPYTLMMIAQMMGLGAGGGQSTTFAFLFAFLAISKLANALPSPSLSPSSREMLGCLVWNSITFLDGPRLMKYVWLSLYSIR